MNLLAAHPPLTWQALAELEAMLHDGEAQTVLDRCEVLLADTAAAAAVASLDLLICVGTSIAHLAGALGMRLFRQPARGDWGAAVDAVRGALVQRVASERRA